MKKIIVLSLCMLSSSLLIYGGQPISIKLSSYNRFEKNIVKKGRIFSKDILTIPAFGRSCFEYSFEERLYVLIEDQFRNDVKRILSKVNWSQSDTIDLIINCHTSRYYGPQQKLYKNMLYFYIKNNFYDGVYPKKCIIPIVDSWIEVFKKKRIVMLH